MARYELAGRFWSIVLTGGTGGRAAATLTTTSGKIGSKGRTTTRAFATGGAAEAQHDDLVLEKLRAGYRLVEQPAVVAGAPIADAAAAALEASIVADPSDTAAYAVYADWLQRQGDPRGELIALQLAREAELARKPRGRSTLQIAIGRHFEDHANTLLGRARGARARRARAGMPSRSRGGSGSSTGSCSTAGRGGDLGAIVEQVLGHPSGRFVRELAIRSDDLDEAHRVVDVLRALAPPTLARARPGGPRPSRSTSARCGPRWRSCAGSRWSRARSISARCACPRPSGPGSRPRGCRAAPCARSRRRRGPRWSGSTCGSAAQFQPSGATLDDLQRLLERGDLPALTHLKLRGCDTPARRSPRSRRRRSAGQLVVIDLSHGLRRARRPARARPPHRELPRAARAVAAQRRLAGRPAGAGAASRPTC